MTSLSTYIRAGADMRPQAFGDYAQYRETPEGYELCTCALGAAYEAITGRTPGTFLMQEHVNAIIYQATTIWGEIIPYPESIAPGKEGLVFTVVEYLNDVERWSRERIADYLETCSL